MSSTIAMQSGQDGRECEVVRRYALNQVERREIEVVPRAVKPNAVETNSGNASEKFEGF